MGKEKNKFEKKTENTLYKDMRLLKAGELKPPPGAMAGARGQGKKRKATTKRMKIKNKMQYSEDEQRSKKDVAENEQANKKGAYPWDLPKLAVENKAKQDVQQLVKKLTKLRVVADAKEEKKKTAELKTKRARNAQVALTAKKAEKGMKKAHEKRVKKDTKRA